MEIFVDEGREDETCASVYDKKGEIYILRNYFIGKNAQKEAEEYIKKHKELDELAKKPQ